MTKMEYYVGRMQIMGVKASLLLMPDATKEYYIPKLMDVARKYAVSPDYHESRLGFILMKYVMKEFKKDLGNI